MQPTLKAAWLNGLVVLDFNRKSPDHVESPSTIFVDTIRIPFSEDYFLHFSFPKTLKTVYISTRI